MSSSIVHILQVIVALGLINVWLLRFNKKTPYRGGSAQSMREEFAAYGLPTWSVYAVGALKILAAIALLVGIWRVDLVMPAAVLVSFLMIGAVLMHLKVRDPLMKSVPAFTMLLLSLGISLSLSV